MYKKAEFGAAKWISACGAYKAPMFRKTFVADDVAKATLLVG